MNVSTEEDLAIRALHKRASESVNQRNIQGAVVALTEILSINPRDFSAYFKLAQIYFAVKYYDKAEQMCQQAIIASTTDIRPWLILGNIYVATNDFVKMATQLSVGLGIDEKNFQLQYLVGYGYAKIGDFQLAKRHLEEAIKLNPNNRQAQQALKAVLLAMSQGA